MAYSAQDPYQDSEEEYRQRLRDLILSSGGDLSGRQTLPDGTIVGFASADSAAKQRAIEEEKAKSLSELASMRIDNNELGVTYGGMNSHRPATLANLVQPQEQSSPQYQPSPAERKAQIGNGFRNESTGAQYAIPSNPSPVYQDQSGAQSGGSSADNLINLGQRQNIPRDQLSAMIQYQASAQPGAPSAEDLYRQSFRFGIPIKDLIAAHSTMGAGDSARIEKDLKIAKARQELEQGGVESQLKRAQLNEALNPKKATGFSSMKEIFDAENKLADDHKMQAKDFIAVRDAYSRLDTAMEKATTSAPAALAGATVFMKLLDPGSVVRESELGMALAATGAIDRMENYYNTLKNGKVLTESQAKEFKLVGKQLYEAAKTNQTQLDQHYTGRAKAYGLDPSKVVGDYYLKEKPASAPTTTPAPALSPAEQQELAQLRARFKK